MDLPVLDFAQTIANLPPQQPEDGLDEAIRKALAERYDVVIVLDDDPTGTQTVYDVPVVTICSRQAIQAELIKGTSLFYLLTNSRALPTQKAADLAQEIGTDIRQAAEELNKKVLLVSRGDSTLRGHYPTEELALRKGLELDDAIDFIIPAFFEGGRFTIDDIHYVKEGSRLIPSAQTPFAKDSTFGYQHSRLQDWVAEKKNHLPLEGIASLSLTEIRATDPRPLVKKIQQLPSDNGVCIVNAADYTDLKRAILVILRSGVKPIFRTAASFVKALLGQPDQSLITLKTQPGGRGGLLIVGSHVPKSTAQLRHLQENQSIATFEVNVPALLNGPEFAERTRFNSMVSVMVNGVEEALSAGQHVLVYTSRELVTANTGASSLNLSLYVSSFLEAVVAQLQQAPAFLLTKGGITSSRIATEALGVKRALVLGQVQPGVPTWELGPESKFPGMPFIIFPGNVGEENSLSLILQNTII